MAQVTLQFLGDAKSLKAAADDAKLALKQVSAEAAVAKAQFQAGILTQQEYNKYMKELAADAVPARVALANVSAQVLEASRSQQGLGNGLKLTSFQMMEFGRIAKDLATGQTAMLQRSSFTLANSMGILAAAFTPVGIAILGGVAILGTLAAAFIAGSREQSAFNNALILTGNYAATTSGNLIDLTSKIGASTGSYSGAQEALTKLAASGKITGDQLLIAGQGVVDFAKITGQSVDKAAEEFIKLADDPAKGIAKLDESMHFLTASTMEQIDVLQQAGDKAGAATLALQALADASKERAGQMVQDAGYIERGWNAVKVAIGGAWDELKGFGESNINAQLRSLQAQLDQTSAVLDNIRKGDMGGGGISALDSVFAKLTGNKDRLVDLQGALIAQIAALKDQKTAQDAAAAAQGAANKTASDAAQIEHSVANELLQHADKATKLANATAEVKAQFDQLRAAGVQTVSGISLQAAETLRLAQVQKEFADSGKGAVAQQNALAAAMKGLDDLYQRQVGGLSATDAAQAKYNLTVSEANALAEKAAIEGGNVDQIILKQNATIAAADAVRQKTLATLAKQADIIGNLNKAAADKAAWDTMTKSQQIVAKTVQDATDKWNKLDDAQKKLAGDLPVVQAAAEQAGEKIADAFNIQHALDGLENLETPFQKIIEKINDTSVALAAAKKHLDDLKNTQALGGVIDLADLKKTEDEVKKLGDGMESLHGKAVELASQSIGQGLASIRSLSKEGSQAYQAMTVAIDVANIAAGIGAILNQGMGDPYSAFARMAAMAAMVATLVGDIGSFTASSFTDTAKERQDTQGTGTVLGDAKTQSDSIAKSLDITAKATTALVGINRGMLTALQSLQQALGSAGTMLAHGAGNATFPGIGATQNGFNQLLGNLDPLGGDPLTKAFSTFLFGGTKKITDQGIDILGGSINQILNGVVIGAYQTIQTSGGLFGSTKTKDNVVGVSDDFNKQMQLVFGSIVDTVKAAATALGIPLADIQAKIDAFKVAETKISLKGLSAEDQQKAIEAVFSSIFDGLAGSVVPFIGQFQKVGEGLGETLVRVATEVQVMQQAVGYLGITVNETDPEKFAQISDGLVGMFASVDDFISAMKGFTDAFAPASYKLKLDGDALASAFAGVGLTVPTTRDGMFALMQTLDATTDAGRKQIAMLLQLAGTADQYYTELDAKAKAQADYQKEIGSLNVSTGKVSPIIDQLHQIQQWAVDESNKLNALAKSAGEAGAAESDLATVQDEAARQAAAAIATLKQSTLDLAAKLGYVDTLDTLNAKISALQSSAGSAASGIGAAATAISAAGDKLNLEISDLSPYSDNKKLDLALQGLRAGTVTADQVLQIGRRLYSSGDDYNKLFQQVMSISPGSAAAAGSGGSGADAGNSAELQELIAQRDKMQAAQDKQNAQQLAQNIADLAQAQKESVQQVAADLGINLDDVAKTLGIGNDKIADFITGLEKQDIAGTYVNESGHIIDAIDAQTLALVAALDGYMTAIAKGTLPDTGAGIRPLPGQPVDTGAGTGTGTTTVNTPPPTNGGNVGTGGKGGGRGGAGFGPGAGNGQAPQEAVTTALLATIAAQSQQANDIAVSTQRLLADHGRKLESLAKKVSKV